MTDKFLMRTLLFGLTFLFISNSLAANCTELVVKILPPEINLEKVISFKKQWLSEKVHVLSQNVSFIAGVKSISSRARSTYFQIENAVLKELNDKILMDKDLVTALDTFLKRDLLNRVNDNQLLSEHLISFYVDFKSLRLHFDTQSGALKSQLNKLYHESIDSFANQVDELGLRNNYMKGRGLSKDPRYWYLAGVGKSNDQANFASRLGRTLFGAGKANHLIDFSNHVKHFKAELVKIDHLRRAVMRANSDLYDTQGVMRLDVIEVFRKIKADDLDSYLDNLAKRLTNRYEREYDRRDLLKLKEYYTRSDLFSPALLIEQRIKIDMSQTVAGNVSIDIAGMGARNMHELMVSLIGAKGREIEPALDLIRRSEVAATEQLDHLREIISGAIDAVEKIRLGHSSPNIHFTGDDLVFFPQNGEYQLRHKLELLKKLSQSDEASNFRVVFLPHRNKAGSVIPHGDRTTKITAAEDLEKGLKLFLEEYIPYERLKKITIASDLKVLDQGFEIDLVVSGANKSEVELIGKGAASIINEKNLGSLERIRQQ